jgi:hypothetical protein
MAYYLTPDSASLERKNRAQHLLMPYRFLGRIFISLYHTIVVGKSAGTLSSPTHIVILSFESTGLGAGSQQAQRGYHRYKSLYFGFHVRTPNGLNELHPNSINTIGILG